MQAGVSGRSSTLGGRAGDSITENNTKVNQNRQLNRWYAPALDLVKTRNICVHPIFLFSQKAVFAFFVQPRCFLLAGFSVSAFSIPSLLSRYQREKADGYENPSSPAICFWLNFREVSSLTLSFLHVFIKSWTVCPVCCLNNREKWYLL